MGIYRAALRTSVAAIILAGSFGASAAIPTQSADLQLTGGFTPVVTDATTTPPTMGPPTKISFGKTIKYTFTLSNLGPGHATGVQLDAPTLPAGTKVTAVTGATCSKDADGNLVFPCPISADLLPVDPANLAATPPKADPNQVTISMTLTLSVPKTAPAACPAGTALGDLAVSVSTDGNTADPVPDNNTVTVAGAGVKEQAYTDVGVTLDGPAFAKVGESVTFTTTVKNNGPCDAAAVNAVLVPGNLLTYASGTGACTDFATDSDPKKGCDLGILVAGQSVSFTSTYKVAALPDSVTQTTIPNEVDVATDTTDVNGDNDVATTGTRVGTEGGGCSSGGPGGLFAVALMAAAVFAARRRRTA